jgi:DNA modification methylase
MTSRSRATTENGEVEVAIAPAKGRPMLHWVGKRPLANILARPAQHMETFDPTSERSGPIANPGIWRDWPQAYPFRGGLLLYGDNKEVLASLLKDFRGKVALIYIDPPFDSGADYVRKVQLRGVSDLTNLEGEGQSLVEQVQYSDIWTNDTYLQFMYERLQLLKELLAEHGSIWLHCDWHRSHHLRLLLDEIFGPENFRNEIVWAYPGREMHIGNKFNAKHDTLLFVAKSEATKINMQQVAMAYDREERLRSLRRKVYTDEDDRQWVWETRGQATGQEPYKRYVDDILQDGRALNDVWNDLQFLRGNDPQRTGFPTQKPEPLLERIIRASSNPGDIVLDCFIGSGTTAAVAQKLGRRWIGCDINKGAIQTTSRRLQAIIEEQVKRKQTRPKQNGFPNVESGELTPAQLLFTIQRVNNYDLTNRYDEAVALACEQLGVTRTRVDGFFDGTLGPKLVKIVPFDHPLSPLDLEAVKRELEVRSGEARMVVMVSLGKQLAADDWLANWNRYRAVTKLDEANRPVEFVNKIETIDLRTDPKYGGFIVHEPARAAIAIARQDGQIRVAIEEFISPIIVARLRMDVPLFQARITDWRAMVNSVEIDTAYDGRVFTIAAADIPERKSDLVAGSYTLPAPDGPTTVAVKITDMLGEEVLVTERV